MTTDEVKGILETISTAIETVQGAYSKEFSATIVDVISKLTPDDIKVFAAVFGMDVAVLNDEIAKVLKLINGLDGVFLTDEASKIDAFVKNLENRPLVLKFLAWNLG